MGVEDITQEEYANRFRNAGLLSVGGVVLFYLIYDSTEGFLTSLIGGVLLLPLILVLAIVSIVMFVKWRRFASMGILEWNEYARTRRAFLSKAIYIHPTTGDVQTVRRGFSIPVFLLGEIYPLIKGQWELAFKFFIVVWACILLGSIIPVIGNFILRQVGTFGLARKYNKYYEDWLIKEGYVLQSTEKFRETVNKTNDSVQRLFK